MKRLLLRLAGSRSFRALAVVSCLALLTCGWQLRVRTLEHLRPVPESLRAGYLVAVRGDSQVFEPVVLVSSDGALLSEDREQELNRHLERALGEMPELLIEAFLLAEDQRFYEHGGVDWRARFHAALQNLLARGGVRGASTITEQAVRILHPRPRTPWSRWLEHFEAQRLERAFDKDQILAFYLNQVPFGRNRRGVAQAAQEYFGRDLATLDVEETLTLAVLVRSPSRLDPIRHPGRVLGRVQILAQRLHRSGSLSDQELALIGSRPLRVGPVSGRADAHHFARFAAAEVSRSQVSGSASSSGPGEPVRQTTLDAGLQQRIQAQLESTIEDLSARQVNDGAVLVIDHETDRVVAWINAFGLSEREGSYYDKILLPRQPGSTLKPFVYALALERGWTPATIIEDAPIEQRINHGVHAYQNYSRGYYGPVRLREALGNSLNTTAIRTVRFVGPETLRQRLEAMAVTSLDRPTEYYGDGLALGNAEISLYELVGAYATLARGGVFRPLQVMAENAGGAPELERQVFDPQVASQIADILSDPGARLLEFGSGSILDLPTQTAIKTGTSSDHNDAWAVGFNHRFVVGVWMGNVDRRPMNGVSGATGPGLVLRSVFSELEGQTESKSLRLDPRLLSVQVCEESGALAGPNCPALSEWLRASDRQILEPERAVECPQHGGRRHGGNLHSGGTGRLHAENEVTSSPEWVSPAPGLHLAQDPRIPDPLESYRFQVDPGSADQAGLRVEWQLDGEVLAQTTEPHFDWPLEKGQHTLSAVVIQDGRRKILAPVNFEVR